VPNDDDDDDDNNATDMTIMQILVQCNKNNSAKKNYNQRTKFVKRKHKSMMNVL
jgi:hypothetical protein